jgi:hypothetical protein
MRETYGSSRSCPSRRCASAASTCASSSSTPLRAWNRFAASRARVSATVTRAPLRVRGHLRGAPSAVAEQRFPGARVDDAEWSRRRSGGFVASSPSRAHGSIPWSCWNATTIAMSASSSSRRRRRRASALPRPGRGSRRARSRRDSAAGSLPRGARCRVRSRNRPASARRSRSRPGVPGRPRRPRDRSAAPGRLRGRASARSSS